MKRVLPFLLIILSLSACNKPVHVPENGFIIQGNIDQALDSIATVIQLNLDSFVYEKVAVKNQAFLLSHLIDSTAQVFLFDSIGRQHTVYVNPKDTLQLAIEKGFMLVSGHTNRYTEWSNETFIKNHPETMPIDSAMPGLIREQLKLYYRQIQQLPEGQRIPYVNLQDEKGATFSTMGETKYQLFTFWASWDSISVARVKQLQALSKKLKEKEITFVSISLDSNDSIWKKKITAYNIPGKNALFRQGFADEGAQKLGIHTLPQNILVNQVAVVVQKDLFGKELEEFLLGELPDKKVIKPHK